MTTALERQLIELHRGHTCDTWQLLLENSAKAAINRTTYAEWVQRHGLVQFFPSGHVFPLDEHGAEHGRPAEYEPTERCTYLVPCIRCDDSWCVYCEPARARTEVCPG